MHCSTKLIMSNLIPKNGITKFIHKQCNPNALHNYAYNSPCIAQLSWW